MADLIGPSASLGFPIESLLSLDDSNPSGDSALSQQILARVDSTEQKIIRLLAGALIATAAGFIAFQGVVGSAAVFAFGYLVTPLIITQAENTVADPNSILTTAQKVEQLLQARLWQETIFTAVCLGGGIGSFYQGAASIFAESPLSLLVGSASVAMGLGGFISGGQSLATYGSHLNNQEVENLIAANTLEKKQASPELAAFVLQLTQEEIDEQTAKNKIEAFLLANQQFSLLDLAELVSKQVHKMALLGLLETNTAIEPQEILARLPRSIFSFFVASPGSDQEWLKFFANNLKTGQAEDLVRQQVASFRKAMKMLSSHQDKFPDNSALDSTSDSLYSTNCATLMGARKRHEGIKKLLEATDEDILGAAQTAARGEDIAVVMESLKAAEQ